MTAHFTPAAFAFLRRLQRNNNREWFHAHKQTYERHVREPFQQLLPRNTLAKSDSSA